VWPANLAEAGPASGARERTFGLCETGIRRSCGRARGLWWLQKSTSGAWSRPKGHGSSSQAPFAGAPGAKGRRKPGRGGESHEHASSDTGGGLLVIPCAERESGMRDRGREHSAMEGVLAQRRAAAFDEDAAARGTAIRCDGDAVLPKGSGRVRGGSRGGTSEAASQARTAVENTVAGRQSAEEPSIGALPGPRCAPHVGARGTAPGRARGIPSGVRVVVAARAEAGALPSSKGSIWLAHRECGQRGLPRISRRSAQAQGELVLFASRSAARRGVTWEARPETQQSAGCS